MTHHAAMAELIRRSYSEDAAARYLTFEPDHADMAFLGEVGRNVLTGFPPMPGSCAAMSALYGALVEERRPDIPVYVTAGTLSVEGRMVFGGTVKESEWSTAFSASNPSWNGHCWLVCGRLIADVSVFRTAYSKHSPPALARFVRETFGEGRGLWIAPNDSEFLYEPRYVLTPHEVTNLMQGAIAIAEGRIAPFARG